MRSIQDALLKAGFILIISNNHFSQRRSTNDLDCYFMAILSLTIMKNTLEQYALLSETARKDYPVLENVNNPMIAPQVYDVRQSG